MKNFKGVDAYLSSFPPSTQKLLKTVRATVKKLAPKAEESISYGMVGYKFYGKPLVYFGGYAKHIGFYAIPSAHAAFKKDLSKYKSGKGSVQFPLDQKLPLPLITKMVNFRIKELKTKYDER